MFGKKQVSIYSYNSNGGDEQNQSNVGEEGSTNVQPSTT